MYHNRIYKHNVLSPSLAICVYVCIRHHVLVCARIYLRPPIDDQDACLLAWQRHHIEYQCHISAAVRPRGKDNRMRFSLVGNVELPDSQFERAEHLARMHMATNKKEGVTRHSDSPSSIKHLLKLANTENRHQQAMQYAAGTLRNNDV